ncbi:hypothetical protein [Pseudomonas lini]
MFTQQITGRVVEPLQSTIGIAGHDKIAVAVVGSDVLFRKVFQLVFQLKTKTDINFINQYLTDRIQITPAHQSENDKARQVRALLHLGFGNSSASPHPL